MIFFFFNDTATTEIYTLSLHDALPIFSVRASLFRTYDDILRSSRHDVEVHFQRPYRIKQIEGEVLQVPGVVKAEDRKSTRLNSSHANISYAVFCLKKKKTNINC